MDSQDLPDKDQGAAARDRSVKVPEVSWVLSHSPGWGSGGSAEEAHALVMALWAHRAASGLCGLSILI